MVIVEEDAALVLAVVGLRPIRFEHVTVGDDIHKLGVPLGHVGKGRVGKAAEQVAIAAIDFLPNRLSSPRARATSGRASPANLPVR